MAARYDYDIDHLDVVTAFLSGDLEEEIYLEQPEGFVDKNHPRKMYRLKKTLYGLKQGAHVWNRKLYQTLIELNFECSKMDQNLYMKRGKNRSVLFLASYDDDLLLFSSDHEAKQSIVKELEQRFKMKNFGAVSRVLGINMRKDRQARRITLDQKNYLEEILRRFKMENYNPVKTSLDVNQALIKEISSKNAIKKEEMRRVQYREVLGCLMYAYQGFRPDLECVITLLGSYAERAHWSVLKRTMP